MGVLCKNTNSNTWHEYKDWDIQFRDSHCTKYNTITCLLQNMSRQVYSRPKWCVESTNVIRNPYKHIHIHFFVLTLSLSVTHFKYIYNIYVLKVHIFLCFNTFRSFVILSRLGYEFTDKVSPISFRLSKHSVYLRFGGLTCNLH